ncbi:MAG TPA: nucleoside phosphorylase [Bacteroidia bacterium]|jgi:uridine phosphorylase|nr:nucleoside phosphorylase [Bacteroidia bacterium]
MLFPETELILTEDKRVYHINLKAEDVADDVILVGDQGRVSKISSFFSKIDFKTEHREFVTHSGWFNGKRITVLSTGIGTDNIDIVMNELDAAVNINLETRELNPKLRSLNIIRFGTSGALQQEIPVNGIVVSSYGLGLDGLLNFYDAWKSINETPISEAFMKHTNWQSNLAYPYCVKAAESLLQKFKSGNHVGITATAPGFYGPQGREIRLKSSAQNLNELLTSFDHNGLKITNFEMETSALYGLGKMLNHNCLTACVIIANRVRKEFTKDYKKSVELLIENSLERLTA